MCATVSLDTGNFQETEAFNHGMPAKTSYFSAIVNAACVACIPAYTPPLP
jgi:hypothetical protein